MKKTFFITAIALLTLSIVSCHKEEENNNNTTPQDTTQTTVQKHNVELKYDLRTDAGCVNIAMDTIRKYNADKYVDTIFLIPEPYTQLAVFGTTPVRNGVNYLRERHNVNPNKVFGKGKMKLAPSLVVDYPEITAFLQDTMKYVIVTDSKVR